MLTFETVCERHKVIGQEIVTLAQLMHDLGYIIYYGEDEGLKDIVVLNPEWLTKAISYVLEDKQTREASGVLDHARLREIWENRDEGPVYPARYHPYFLRLMEKFDVSYRLEGDEFHSLVAQLVPHERPILPWEFSTERRVGIRTLAMVCQLGEAPPGIIPWMTVRHHRASTGMHWRRGVFLRHPNAAYASEALVELRHSNELAVEVRAPSPDLYFNVLRDSIEDLITRRWPGLTYRLFIPCPGSADDDSSCHGQFPLDKLLRMRERGRTSVPCLDCTDDYEISRLLTGFELPSQALSVKLEQMDDQVSRIQDNMILLQVQAADTAQAVRRVLRVVSTEVIDCPRLFTLSRERGSVAKRMRVHQDHYRLTLWCEHLGYWHPWEPATYHFDQPKDWFAKVYPYVVLVSRTLQLVVPLAGFITEAVLPPKQLEIAKPDVQLMDTLVGELPGKATLVPSDTGGMGESAGRLTVAEGQALRAIRAILFKHDRLRAFGGLRRVQAPSGDFLWVCSDHYPEYDPGLPTVP